MRELIRALCGLLEEGEDVVVASILVQEGSAPRTAGTKMIVRKTGAIAGTIGGGLLEATVLRRAPEVLAAGGALLHAFDLTKNDVAGMDMICGGRLSVLIERVEATTKNREVFEALREAQEAGRKGVLVTALGPLGAHTAQVERCFVPLAGTGVGRFPFPDSWLDDLRRHAAKSRVPLLLTEGEERFFVEPCAAPGKALLFGAGHLTSETEALAAKVGFRTFVFDDRPEFANRERYPLADGVKVLPSFESCFEELDVDEDGYVVIVTRGHSFDKIVLEQALRTRAGYVGMIGSKHKRDAIYRALREQGFEDEDLARVHCPIGVEIEAETPEEIAVSIVGELILSRARRGR